MHSDERPPRVSRAAAGTGARPRARAAMTRRGFLCGVLATLGGVSLAAALGPRGTQAAFARGAGLAAAVPTNDWLSLPTDWDAGWRAARDGAASAPAWITIL